MVTVQPPAPCGMVSPEKESVAPNVPALKVFPGAPGQVPPAATVPLPATAMAALSASVNAAEVSGTVSELTSVKTSVEAPPVWITAGLNAFEMVGGAVTTSVAVFDGGPEGRSAVVTPDVVLVCVPALELVTVKVSVQPAAGITMLVKSRLVWPAVSTEGVMPAQPAMVCAELTDIPVSVSLKAPASWGTPVGFCSWIVTVETPPLAIRAGLNDLTTPMVPTPSRAVFDGAPAATVSLVVTPPAVFE